MNTYFVIAFILGITSSLHCIGMCGPIALAVPVNRKSNLTIALGLLQFNFGRIFTYAILGLLLGTIGLTVQSFQIMQVISIFAGVLLILYALKKQVLHLLPNKWTNAFNLKISASIGKIMKSNSPFKLFGLGLTNGLLPCGMVYLALINALLIPGAINTALSMVFFGLGTLPALFSVGFFAQKISNTIKNRIAKIIPFAMIVLGMAIILRGLNLGIPYLSPKIELTAQMETSKETTSPQEIQFDCCHSTQKCAPTE